MKQLLIILLFSCISQSLLAQDTLELADPWREVKGWLLKRIQLTKKLTASLDNKKSIVKGSFVKPESIADSLEVQINSITILDSVTIRKIDLTNNHLTTALEPYLNLLNNNPKLKYKTDLIEYQVQLEATENRLQNVARDFNKKANELGRGDLCFKLLGTSIPPEVKLE
jgi:hypothetical protein